METLKSVGILAAGFALAFGIFVLLSWAASLMVSYIFDTEFGILKGAALLVLSSIVGASFRR